MSAVEYGTGCCQVNAVTVHVGVVDGNADVFTFVDGIRGLSAAKGRRIVDGTRNDDDLEIAAHDADLDPATIFPYFHSDDIESLVG